MIVIIGCVIVVGAVLTGFTIAGGHVGALIQPSEFVTIMGAAIGAMVLMSPKKVLVDLFHGILRSVKGTPYNRQAYEQLLKVSYDLLRLARRDGLVSLDAHVSDPASSAIFNKYPVISGNQHVMSFIGEALWPVIDGTARPEQVPRLLEAEIQAIEEVQHAPLAVLAKIADALPGFGIVAAVLGIVVTMGSIDGPVEQVGEHVAAALVGTFLGVLLSYGFFGPLVVRMEFLDAAEVSYFRTISAVIQGLANGSPPKVAIEQACRNVNKEFRPSRERLAELFAEAEAA